MKKVNIIRILCLMGSGSFAQSVGWTSQKLADGVFWKKTIGYLELFGSPQNISIIDVDLSKTKARLDFINSKNKFATLDKLVEGSGAIAAINGTYPDQDSEGRWGSFFKRKDSVYQTIEYSDDHPLYWKSEGCISINSDGGIHMRLGNKALYEHMDHPYVMSSAPVLVQEGIPIGKYIIKREYTKEELDKLHYEDKTRHQGLRHPRTAIGLTSDNHFLMVVVDGRSEQAAGMNAYELTILMHDILRCEQALNLDGGGSSTMWIINQPHNGILNHPTDNGKFDHDGARSISMAITISK